MKSEKTKFLPRYVRSVLYAGDGYNSFSTALIPSLSAGWYLIWARHPVPMSQWLIQLRLQGRNILTELVLARPFNWKIFGLKLGVFFLPDDKTEGIIQLFGTEVVPATLRVHFIPLGRPMASIGVILQNFMSFRESFWSRGGSLSARLRQAVAMAATNRQSFPETYATWLKLYEDLNVMRLDKAAGENMGKVSALVCSGHDMSTENLNRTIASLAAQRQQPDAIISIRGRMGGVPDEARYFVILQSGEQLVPHALQIIAREIETHDFPEILYGDEDRLSAEGHRSAPVFRPQPNVLLMCSGTLGKGVWVVRRNLLPEDLSTVTMMHAEIVRLKIWFRLFLAGSAHATFRVPRILTSRHIHTNDAPAKDLSNIVNDFLREAGILASTSPGYPLYLQWESDKTALPKVSLIVASKLEGETQLSCMLRILEATDYEHLEMIVVVTQSHQFSPRQQQIADELMTHKNVRIHVLAESVFNYARANNFAVSLAESEFICLLNDDVSPLDVKWLQTMISMFSVPDCGAVGPKLLYPDLTVQHGGVIVGVAGLADHMHRHINRKDPGYAWRAGLDQELSAVTGACILLRRRTFEQLGGLDERFPILFNDVDFCLRMREQRLKVIYAGSVEMIHHETISFGGKHYDSSQAAQQAADIALFKTRWSRICQNDPFHNPNLSLAPNSEWKLAFPPRHYPASEPVRRI